MVTLSHQVVDILCKYAGRQADLNAGIQTRMRPINTVRMTGGKTSRKTSRKTSKKTSERHPGRQTGRPSSG